MLLLQLCQPAAKAHLSMLEMKRFKCRSLKHFAGFS